MLLFYAPDLQGDHYTLNEQESRHCIKVLRLRAGDAIQLTNGMGDLCEAELINEDPRHCEVLITSKQKEYGQRPNHLHIAIAPTKNINRFEWFLEKATEIGIDEITPVICTRSERKVVKNERLNKVITAAMKQSLKAYHPVLNEQLSFKEFMKIEQSGDKFIAYIEEGEHPSLNSIYVAENSATILIGPEGDFSPEEVEMAIKHGYKTVSLGKSRLRTETAGIVACHTVGLMNEY